MRVLIEGSGSSRRVLIAQDASHVHVSIATFGEDYVDYIKRGKPDESTFLRIQEYGPLDVTKYNHMQVFATLMLAFALNDGTLTAANEDDGDDNENQPVKRHGAARPGPAKGKGVDVTSAERSTSRHEGGKPSGQSVSAAPEATGQKTDLAIRKKTHDPTGKSKDMPTGSSSKGQSGASSSKGSSKGSSSSKDPARGSCSSKKKDKKRP